MEYLEIKRRYTTYTAREFYALFILCFIYLAIFMDRFCLLVLGDHIGLDYNATYVFKRQQLSAFIIGCAISSPIYGYLGDRVTRRILIFVTLTLCSIATFLGTIAPTAWLFIWSRFLVGFFQSGFCVVTPSIISDIARDASFSIQLTYCEVMVPMGLLLGILLSEIATKQVGHWYFCLYITSAAELILAICYLCGVTMKRGLKDAEELTGEKRFLKATSYWLDLQKILTNKTFLLGTAGVTCIGFFGSAIAWYMAYFLILGDQIISERLRAIRNPNVATAFGSLSMAGGVFGITIGSFIARTMKPYIHNVDPMICGLGMLISVPLVALALLTCESRTWETFFYLFFALTLMNFVWPLFLYSQQYTVLPTRRSSVRGLQEFVTQLGGNLLAPHVLERLRAYYTEHYDYSALEIRYDMPDIDIKPFFSIRFCFYTLLTVQFVGSVFFIWNTFYIIDDIQKAKDETIELVKRQRSAESEKNLFNNEVDKK